MQRPRDGIGNDGALAEFAEVIAPVLRLEARGIAPRKVPGGARRGRNHERHRCGAEQPAPGNPVLSHELDPVLPVAGGQVAQERAEPPVTYA